MAKFFDNLNNLIQPSNLETIDDNTKILVLNENNIQYITVGLLKSIIESGSSGDIPSSGLVLTFEESDLVYASDDGTKAYKSHLDGIHDVILTYNHTSAEDSPIYQGYFRINDIAGYSFSAQEVSEPGTGINFMVCMGNNQITNEHISGGISAGTFNYPIDSITNTPLIKDDVLFVLANEQARKVIAVPATVEFGSTPFETRDNIVDTRVHFSIKASDAADASSNPDLTGIYLKNLEGIKEWLDSKDPSKLSGVCITSTGSIIALRNIHQEEAGGFSETVLNFVRDDFIDSTGGAATPENVSVIYVGDLPIEGVISNSDAIMLLASMYEDSAEQYMPYEYVLAYDAPWDYITNFGAHFTLDYNPQGDDQLSIKSLPGSSVFFVRNCIGMSGIIKTAAGRSLPLLHAVKNGTQTTLTFAESVEAADTGDVVILFCFSANSDPFSMNDIVVYTPHGPEAESSMPFEVSLAYKEPATGINGNTVTIVFNEYKASSQGWASHVDGFKEWVAGKEADAAKWKMTCTSATGTYLDGTKNVDNSLVVSSNGYTTFGNSFGSNSEGQVVIQIATTDLAEANLNTNDCLLAILENGEQLSDPNMAPIIVTITYSESKSLNPFTITGENTLEYSDSYGQQIKVYYESIPGIFDELSRHETNYTNFSLNVENADGSTKRYFPAVFQNSYISDGSMVIAASEGESNDYQIGFSSGTNESLPEEIRAKDTVVVSASVIGSNGSDIFSDVPKSGYPKKFTWSFDNEATS